MQDRKEAKESNPQTIDAESMASLRFLYLSSLGAETLGRQHAKKYGSEISHYSELFCEIRQASEKIILANSRALPLKRHLWRIGMHWWGFLSARVTKKFAIEMQDHLLRKMILQIRSLAQAANATDAIEQLNFRFTPKLESASERAQQQAKAERKA